jgi:ATP-dependent Clp protease ATP-binding subunit ClpC
MAAQYFPEQHEPGRTLRLLEDALREALQAQPCRLPLDQDGLLRAVSFRSGLPLEVIDDRQSLDLGAIRAFFHKRVIGQEEAVECLVDRIAMLKAGLSDGNRPIGVFLFAGPTGTGKTELAKTLGQLLFGSDERLLRLDMSEYQSGDALARMLDDDRQGGSRSLVSRIREQPFSVVLLDEFEKAHPSVWDLFLQVFDAGRLSDRSGNVADFRHAIIILTSNAGSTLSRTAGPGFTSTAGGYSRSVVEKALFETFRKEFLNRIDRVVLFKPLDRSLMREILYKELDLVLTRRGLRNRDWAIEWEPSAVEFLLDRGFTPYRGARPLRRAIDQYLLAPLARRIVGRDAPEGDQFLFVRASGDRLEVEFVDPDAPLPIPAIPDEATGDYSLPGLVYSPVASPLAVDYLHAQRRRLAEAISSEPWSLGRAEDFAAMAQTGFWERPERFAVLDRIERRDRIESALQTADRLGNRLGRSGNGDAKFLARFAQLLWLLELAMRSLQDRRPQDALLHLSVADGDLRRDLPGAWQWLQQILAMYLAWAEKRNMRVEVLEQSKEKGTAWLAVSGFAALELLDAEAGLHVLEADEEESMPRRISVRIRIAPDLPGQRRSVPPASIGDNNVRRRYRSGPSPLVRNTAPSWRTGRLDRVLAGDFDIVPTT